MKVWNTLVAAVAAEARRLRTLSLHQWVQTVGGAWMLVAAVLLLTGEGRYSDVAFQQTVSLPVVLAALVLIVLAVLQVGRRWPRLRAEGYLLVFATLLVCVLLALKADNFTKFYLYYGVAAVAAVLLFYAARQGLLTLPVLKLGRVSTAAITTVLLVLMGGMIGVVGTMRYLCFATPNFDFGIFAQMFHYMKETLLPLTTCERNGLLSHFAVHISPIYYLLLPFYALFPSPITLAIGQGAIIASGGIPLYLLSRKFGLSYKQTLAVVVAYAAYPAFSCGTLYDLHENCFLAPLLLWMFYFYECGKTWPLVIAVALVLTVKEDAAVYVALFALYQAVSQRRLRKNAPIFLAAVAYFLVAVMLLDLLGDGAMMGRYDRLQYEDGGLFSMLKTLIINPGLFLQTVFAPVDTNMSKLRYLAQLIVPLGVVLFTTRRPSRLILLLPVLLNLLGSSVYQCDLIFQYHFGVSAFFFYLCLLNLRDLPPAGRSERVSYMAVSALLLYILLFLPHIQSNVERYAEKKETYQQMAALLDTVPEDASVTCSTFLLPHLAQREIVYEDFYHQETDTEYLVLDLRPGYNGKADETEAKYAAAGYTVVTRAEDMVLIMKRGE